jgi:hypothetical protein
VLKIPELKNKTWVHFLQVAQAHWLLGASFRKEDQRGNGVGNL